MPLMLIMSNTTFPQWKDFLPDISMQRWIRILRFCNIDSDKKIEGCRF